MYEMRMHPMILTLGVAMERCVHFVASRRTLRTCPCVTVSAIVFEQLHIGCPQKVQDGAQEGWPSWTTVTYHCRARACVILSGAAWLQVCLLSQYKCTTAMRALHSAVQKECCGSPHSVPATFKVLHHLSYHMPDKRCRVVSRIKRWLDTHAFWAGEAYSSWRLPDHLIVHGINGVWC